MRIAFIDDSDEFLYLCKVKVDAHNAKSDNQIAAMYFTSAKDFTNTLEKEGQLFEYAVIDLLMPKVNGFDLAEELKAKYPNMKEIICTDCIGNCDQLNSFISKKSFNIENIIERFTKLNPFRNLLEIGIRKGEYEAGLVYG